MMEYKEILVKNPITLNSIDQLFVDIKSCNSQFLIINVGSHNFESIEVLKELKSRFNIEANALNRFRKIAFIHSSEIINKSENEDRYNFFFERKDAISWLTAI